MEKKRAFITNVLFYGLIFLILWGVCKVLLPVLLPFLIAFVIASILQFPVRKLRIESRRGNRLAAVLLTVAIFVIFFALLVIAGLKISGVVSDFLMSAPEFYRTELVPALSGIADEIEELFSNFDPAVAEQVVGVYQDFVDNIGNHITNFSVNALKVLTSSIAGIPGIIIKFIITIISTFFFMLDYDKIMDTMAHLIPAGRREQVANIQDYLKNSLLIYLRSYTLLCILTFVELSIGFYIMKIPYAVLIGLAVAIFDILPILGTGGILMPWAVVLFLMKDIPRGIGMLALYLVITAIRNTLEPKLVGKQIGLHPLATLISMYLGLKMIGILGMFLFPVSLTVILAMRRDRKEAAEH